MSHSFDLFFSGLGTWLFWIYWIHREGCDSFWTCTFHVVLSWGWGYTHLSSVCLACTKPWVQLLAPYELGVKVHTCSPNTQEDGGRKIQVILGYIVSSRQSGNKTNILLPPDRCGGSCLWSLHWEGWGRTAWKETGLDCTVSLFCS